MLLFHIVFIVRNNYVLLIRQWYLKSGEMTCSYIHRRFWIVLFTSRKTFSLCLKFCKTVSQLHLSWKIVYDSPFFFGMPISSSNINGARDVSTGLFNKLQKLYCMTKEQNTPGQLLILLCASTALRNVCW